MAVKNFYRILCVVLASQLLISSLHYDVNLHYCQSKLVGVSLKTNSNCCKKTSSTCGQKNHTEYTEEKDCCTNEAFHVDSLDQEYLSYATLSFDVKPHIAPHLVINPICLINRDALFKVNKYDAYRPPPPDIDVQSFYQVYLI